MAVVQEEVVVLNLDGRWKLWEGMSERRGSLIMIHYESYITKVLSILKCIFVMNAMLNF